MQTGLHGFAATCRRRGGEVRCEMEQQELLSLPIGVFDSGVGGISVLREMVALMPQEHYLYFGDSKNAPYGTRPIGEVRELSLRAAECLSGEGIKALVVACNTATSAAIGDLRAIYDPMPVIGIEPALKPAALSGGRPRVLVMATPMTLREEKFRGLLKRYGGGADIIALPCPGLVEFVERGVFGGAELRGFLDGLFSGIRGERIDCVVLGCTHYPFVRDAIRDALGGDVKIFDGGAGTAREARRRLMERSLLRPPGEKGEIRIVSSEDGGGMEELARRLLDAP